MEIWKDIKGFEGLYQVSNMGAVKSVDRVIIEKNNRKVNRKGKLLKEGRETCGYSFVSLNYCGVRKYARVHRLVAEAFLDNPYNKPQINHIDGNKQNNKVTNLEYCTKSENMFHAYKMGLRNRVFPVEMLDKETGEAIKRFSSTAEAVRYLGCTTHSAINNCLHGRNKTAYGYKWRRI